MKNILTISNVIVIAVTAILFIVAIFAKGFTHDLLIEAAVLLVSVKLIIMNQKNKIMEQKILDAIEEIKKMQSGS
ncbi:MAG TPA: hypothetical protein VHB70_05495 [Parafilimonas sp.]|nr:hypothetical protein [Parafilimonas sp.]